MTAHRGSVPDLTRAESVPALRAEASGVDLTRSVPYVKIARANGAVSGGGELVPCVGWGFRTVMAQFVAQFVAQFCGAVPP